MGRGVAPLVTRLPLGQNGGTHFSLNLNSMPQSVASLKTLSRNLVRSFSAMLLVLLALLGFALWNFHRLAQADGWKAHTYQVLLESQRLKESLFIIDSGVRGWVINGTPNDLAILEGGKRDFRGHFRELQQLVSDAAAQEQNLSEALRKKDFYLEVAAPILRERVPSDSLQEALLKSSRTSVARRVALDDARATLNAFEAVEKDLLAGRIKEQERWQRLTEATLWAGSAFSILLTLLLSSICVRAVRESNSAYVRLRDSNSRLEGALAQVQEIKSGLELEVTQRRAAEERLRRAVGDLKRSNTELEQFAYVASHDLQEPLRAVAGCVQVLKRRYEGKLDERADQFIGHAVDGAMRMQNLIHDLLAYSRVGTKGKAFTHVSLDQVVDGALQNLSVAVKESGARIKRAPLPTLRGDAGQLEQVFQNLLSNALKFRGDAPPEIEIGCEETRDETRGEGWTFSVSDRGPGIEPQYFERIFVMFQRLHTRTEYPGTGIGLAIVKKIIERHGGYIEVQSEVGQGTTFVFFLPQNAPDEQGIGDEDVASGTFVEKEGRVAQPVGA